MTTLQNRTGRGCFDIQRELDFWARHLDLLGLQATIDHASIAQMLHFSYDCYVLCGGRPLVECVGSIQLRFRKDPIARACDWAAVMAVCTAVWRRLDAFDLHPVNRHDRPRSVNSYA